jgi:hypothetical protein
MEKEFYSFEDFESFAAGKNWQNTRNIESGKIVGYTKKSYDENLDKCSGLEIKGYSKIVPLIVVSKPENEDYYLLEYIRPIINVNGLLLIPTSQSFNNKSFEFILHKEINSVKIRGVKFDLEKPNKIGKATVKKFTEWIDYLQAIEVLKASELNRIDEKVNKFFEDTKDLGIVWNKERTKGEIKRGGLIYKVDISDDGYIYQRWEKNVFDNDIKTFLAISDNKF